MGVGGVWCVRVGPWPVIFLRGGGCCCDGSVGPLAFWFCVGCVLLGDNFWGARAIGGVGRRRFDWGGDGGWLTSREPSLNGGALASQKCHFGFVTGVLEKDVRKKGHVVGLTLKRTKLKRGGGCELGLEFCWIWFVVG